MFRINPTPGRFHQTIYSITDLALSSNGLYRGLKTRTEFHEDGLGYFKSPDLDCAAAPGEADTLGTVPAIFAWSMWSISFAHPITIWAVIRALFKLANAHPELY